MTLNWQTLVELTNSDANTLVSIYMPMHAHGPRTAPESDPLQKSRG